MKKIAVFFGTGYEEVEALTTVDILRRGGVEVSMLSIDDTREVTSSHNVTIVMDGGISHCNENEYDGVMLPGGMPGMTNLLANKRLQEILIHMNEQGKLITAICASPSVLGLHGLLKDKEATCYPGFEDNLKGALCKEQAVVQADNIITSRGPGTSFEFGLTILANLVSKEVAEDVAKKMLL